jgi:hypothetical protein
MKSATLNKRAALFVLLTDRGKARNHRDRQNSTAAAPAHAFQAALMQR